jgi:hypothetical protein
VVLELEEDIVLGHDGDRTEVSRVCLALRIIRGRDETEHDRKMLQQQVFFESLMGPFDPELGHSIQIDAAVALQVRNTLVKPRDEGRQIPPEEAIRGDIERGVPGFF